MATKTEEGAAAGTEAHTDDESTAGAGTAEKEAPRAEAAGPTAAEDAAEAGTGDEETAEAEDGATGAKEPSGVGLGAGAVVSAVLGLVSLSGGWIGTVAGARQQLIGQLRTSSTASVTTQIRAVYGDSWHTTALWAGLFALAGLLTGVVVLARPAFGAPGRPQASWVRSVAWAGVSLGVIGLLLAVLKYSDALLALPSTR
ncbi:hypothetical protein ACWEN3_22530 [Streptomyces sp. NPDC004561]